MTSLNVLAVSVQRPIFRGDKAAVWNASRQALEPLLQAHGAALQVLPEPVTDGDGAAAAAVAIADAMPDLVLVQATTFATAECFLPLLRTGRPTCLWAVPEPTLTGPLPLNSFCGVNFISSLLSPGEQVKWLYGDATDPAFVTRLEATLRALRAVRRLSGSKVLWIGGTAPTFERFEVDPMMLEGRFGVELERVDLERLFRIVAEVPDHVATQAAESMSTELDRCQVTPAQLLPCGRLDVALRKLIVDGGYDAAALRCWPECCDRTGAQPCASVARLFDEGHPTACEGDVLGAVSMLALAALAETDPILLDLSHVTDDALCFWHCGNGPKSLAEPGSTELQTHFNRPDFGAVRAMRMAPGEATMLRFTSLSEAAVFEGQWSAGPPAFDGLSGWLRDVRWRGSTPLSAKDTIATVLDRHLPHHFAFASGRLAEPAIELCGWLGIELLEPSAWRDGMELTCREN